MVLRPPRYFTNTSNKYDELFERAAKANNIDPLLLKTVWYLESSGKPDIHNSTAGAQGPFQFMPKTWQSEAPKGADVHDINQAAFVAAKYLRKGLDQTGSVEGALGFYNSGSTNPQVWTNQETASYIRDAHLNWGNMYQNAGFTPPANNDQVISDTVGRLRNQQSNTQPGQGAQVLQQALDAYRKDQQAQTAAGGQPSPATPPQTGPLSGADVLRNAYAGYKADQEQNAQDDDAKDKALDKLGGKMSEVGSLWQGLKSGVTLGQYPAVEGALQRVNPLTGYNTELGNYSALPGLQARDKSGEQATQEGAKDQERARLSNPELFEQGRAVGNMLTQGGLQAAGTAALTPLVGPVAGNALAGAGVGALSTRTQNPDASAAELGEGAASGALVSSLLGGAGASVSALLKNPLTRYLFPGHVLKNLGQASGAVIANPFSRGYGAAIGGDLVGQLNGDNQQQ